MTLTISIDRSRRQRLEAVRLNENETLDVKITGAEGAAVLVLLPVIGPEPVPGKLDKLSLVPDGNDFVQITPLAAWRVAHTSQLLIHVYDYVDADPFLAATGVIELIPVGEPEVWPGETLPGVVTYSGAVVSWQFDPLTYSGPDLGPDILLYQGEVVTHRGEPVTFQT